MESSRIKQNKAESSRIKQIQVGSGAWWSERLHGADVDGLREDEMPTIAEQVRRNAFVQEYGHCIFGLAWVPCFLRCFSLAAATSPACLFGIRQISHPE